MRATEQQAAAHMGVFWLGIGIAALALLTPMDMFGMNYLFTVHMTQHLALSLLAPPLVIFGAPRSALRRLFAWRWSKRSLRILTNPFVAAALFNGNIWLWHAPLLMYVMMAQPALHLLSNLLYLVTGLFFWWPLLSPLEEEGHALSLGGKLAYLFFSDMPMMLLGAGLTFGPALYTMPMGSQASMAIPATDQQLGGLLMWVGGGIFLYVVVGSGLFLRWMLRQERLEEAREASLEEEEALQPEQEKSLT
jgi:cytochrome c oxidase assembly factor CtaG